jgi:hypothetical protein
MSTRSIWASTSWTSQGLSSPVKKLIYLFTHNNYCVCVGLRTNRHNIPILLVGEATVSHCAMEIWFLDIFFIPTQHLLSVPVRLSAHIQWKPLIIITLGPALFDNNNRLITSSGGYKNLHCLTQFIVTTFACIKNNKIYFKNLCSVACCLFVCI